MQYESFSRYLREKYSTRLHVADQLADQLKDNNRLRVSSTSVHELNMIKAQQEISFPLVSYLNKFEYDEQKSIKNKKEFEPYFNECLLAAERVKHNRCSYRDRQICYENLILAEKLERIKKQPKQNTRMNLQKDGRSFISTANCEHDAMKSTNNRFTTKLDAHIEKMIITSRRSSLSIERESKTVLSETEDDQATAADVDVSMEYCDSTCSVPHKQRNIFQKNRSFNGARIYSSKNQNQKFFETENDRVYQHLSNIDMLMVRDTIPLPTSQTPKHFSICILPHFDSDATKKVKNHSKVLPHDGQYAFKKEILYH
jgi:hypothetical protein